MSEDKQSTYSSFLNGGGEEKWQKRWEEKPELFQAEDGSKKPKYYYLVEFPYPSGAGLHVGHVRSYTALDVMARKARLEGKNVLYPIGWDAFGLPTENYAIKNRIHPRAATAENIATFKRQLKRLGLSFDWSREINTTDPNYYQWTQWIFGRMFKEGLAYKARMPVNWCPSCKIGLANEEVVEGKCERCGTPVEQREREQWLLKITKYADRLLKDLKKVDYSERIRTQQENWIGRSEGFEISFKLKNIPGQEDGKHEVKVFTTRIDTIFGATYLAVAPELAKRWLEVGWQASAEVKKYVEKALTRREETRTVTGKTGVDSGIRAVNPANGEEIPVWVADYVLAQYGTGAVMAVPAHDERDFDFAAAHNLPIRPVVLPKIIDKINPPQAGKRKVRRRTVHAIVKNTRDGTYLGLRWKQHPWTTFIVGGVSEDEDVEAAARREVREETGYKNLRLVGIAKNPVSAEYYAAHKEENRVAITTGVFFELVDGEREEIAPEEKEKHEPVWLELADLPEDFTCAELDVWRHYLDGKEEAYTGEGELFNSGEFDGFESGEAREKIAIKLGAEKKVNYHLRDWVFSRQRYWGEPMPLVFCEQCAARIRSGELEARNKGEELNPGWMMVSEAELPVVLPEIDDYQPTDAGESPLAKAEDWVRAECPRCGGGARRETDTMPNWAGSSWYFLRYLDPQNKKELASQDKSKYWLPVDLYNGGMEHTTLHLLYSRFWYKFLYDIGAVPEELGSEPYARRRSHGVVLAEDGRKMSKSYGNVVNPDEIVDRYGADTLRLYEMFMGPFADMIPWNTNGLKGVYRFLERVWNIKDKVREEFSDQGREILMQRVIKKVGEDMEAMKFNTAVSQLMIAANNLAEAEAVRRELWEKFLIVLAPFAPHLAEELWEKLRRRTSIFEEVWPSYDEELIKEEKIKIAVQVNGRTRAVIEIEAGAVEAEVKEQALKESRVNKWIENGKINKTIFVADKLINFVV